MSTAGVLLPNGCRVTHGSSANVKMPFPDIPLVMHELYAGEDGADATSFRGQFGFIPFNDQLRLPRHVHIDKTDDPAERSLLAERILVLNGVGLTELNGELLLVPPGSLVHIEPGVPHTWTACPAGVCLPDGSVSDGTFLMIYEYTRPTGFFPIERTTPISALSEYEPYTGDLEEIRFPKLTPEQVVEHCAFVWDKDVRNDLSLGS